MQQKDQIAINYTIAEQICSGRIIVGVKYCFRYNQRNRQQRNDENGEPIDMTAMPRTHRRRREKKLMTMDEVNDRFPLTKYKAWVTSRAEEGLSTEGGVASPRSRPTSLKHIHGALSNNEPTQKTEEGERSITPSGPSPEMSSIPIPPDSASPDSHEKLKDPVAKETTTSPPNSPVPPSPHQVHEDDDDDDDMDDDDQIQIAVPTEMLATPGDSCAICLDTLEDDDDVRGLTCGHAFHASCVDPWLTSRRACCPLCKTDYHIPKPRPEGDAAIDAERHTGRRQAGPSGGRDNPPPNSLPYGFTGGRTGTSFRPRLIFPGRFLSIGNRDSRQNRNSIPVVAQLTRPPTRRPTQATVVSPTTNVGPSPETGNPSSWRSRIGAWRPRIPLPNRFRRNNNTPVTTESDGAPQAGATVTGTSPGQLEAGVR